MSKFMLKTLFLVFSRTAIIFILKASKLEEFFNSFGIAVTNIVSKRKSYFPTKS